MIHTDARASVILIRLLVGLVFLSEGIQKFLFTESLGLGRFIRIGLPHPAFLSPFVGCFEIVCGALVMAGLATRLASIPLLIIISTAIITTKIPILLHSGIWAMMHEARTDGCMLLGSLFLLVQGGGRWSIDFKLIKNKSHP